MRTKRTLAFLDTYDGVLPPTATELYSEYEEARIAFEALDEDESKLSDTGREIMSNFEILASLYALSGFGYAKVSLLHPKMREIEQARIFKDIDIENITKAQYRKLSKSLESSMKLSTLSNALSNGYYQLKSRYEQIEVKPEPSIENAPAEIAEAIETHNLSLRHFFDALKVHKSLGADIPVISGSIFWRLFSSKGRYEDYHEETLGYFGSKREAHLALADFILKESEGATRQTPWGLLNEIDDPTVWDEARFEWFNKATFNEMIQWYCVTENNGNIVDFHLVKHVISSQPNGAFEPNGLMDVNLEE